MRIGSVGGLHASLLMSYVGVMHEVHREPVPGQTSEQGSYSARWLASVRHMASAYVTTGEVWQLVFRTMAEDGTEWEGKEKVLGEVYGQWQCKNEIEATLEWGKWLLGAGQAQAAAEAVAGCARRLGESERRELEKRWMGMLMSGSGP
ncbi:hypothetical protein H0H81_012782 [Sphagnurus paluster]|uniref:Uncharacterized protein n=1 Tax=Sphagnurus paluster TaxID=117069 RepID=A0A9P7GJ60_9AGAR|nr:hypothetical protein H0H81_012782 [Sphagnurus paluster]